MKKMTLSILFFLFYFICFSQNSTNFQIIPEKQIVLNPPIEKLKFENGHVKFSIRCNKNNLVGNSAIVNIKAINKNKEIIFSCSEFDLRDTKLFDKPFNEVFTEYSLLNCVLEDGKIDQIFVDDKCYIDALQFSKFQDMVIDFLLKDKKFGKIITCCISKMDTTTTNPLFKVCSHIFREACQKQIAAKTDSLTYQLNEKIGALDDYVRKNPFSVLDKADFDKNKDSILAIIRQYEKEIKEIVPVFEYENVELRIDSLEEEIKKYFDLCGILLTPQNSLTIEPSLRGIYSINYQIENHNSIGRKLSLIYLIKIYELINSFANNKENEIQYPKYQRELKRHLNTVQNSLGDLKNGENTKNILSEIDSFKYNNIIDNISNRFDSKNELRNKLDTCSIKEKFEIASLIYIGYLQLETFLLLNESEHNELFKPTVFENYKEEILKYDFKDNPIINDFNHFVDSLVYLTTKVRSLFANDISLMVKRSNSGNEIIRKEIDSLIRNCDENEKLFVSKMKDCSDSILFLWVANVIDDPSDYYNNLLSIKQAIESNKFPNFKNKNSNTISDANLFRTIYDEMKYLHNKAKSNPLCLQQENELRKEIYKDNSLYLDSIIYHNNDSVSSRYVGFLVNKLLKISVLNDCIKNGIQCSKCFEYYFVPKDLIPRSFLSEEGFKARIKDFKNRQNEHFKPDNTFKVDKTLTVQSQNLIKSLLKNHPYVFDDYYKNEMENDKKLVYVRNYFKTHPEKCEEILTDTTLIACAANLKQFYGNENYSGGSTKKNPSPNRDEQQGKKEPPGKNRPNQNNGNYRIDEKELATSLSEKIAPKLNFLNLDTYIGSGVYYIPSDSFQGWLQPISLEFETTLNESFDAQLSRWKCYQPFLRANLSMFSSRGGVAEFGYGIRFIKPQKNYVAFSPFLECEYFNNTSVLMDTVLIKTFYEGEAGLCFDWNMNWNKGIFNNRVLLHRLNLKFKLSHSISDFHRTYTLSRNVEDLTCKYFGVSFEPSINVGCVKIKAGIKHYFLAEDYFRDRYFIQFLVNLNYLKHK